MFPYTVALTSCARFDLLERTLASLLPRLEGPCERIIVGEDSGDRGVLETVERFRPGAPPIQVILNPRRLGICRNIDRIYEEVRTTGFSTARTIGSSTATASSANPAM